MKSSGERNELLSQLKRAALAPNFSTDSLISTIESLLLWLNVSHDNTDGNCKEIDYFISVELITDKTFEHIPEDIRSILFDMGTTLHDTHTFPEIARNFESTPTQLLSKVRNL